MSTRQAITPKAAMLPKRTKVARLLVRKERKASAVVTVVTTHGPPTSFAAQSTA